MSNRSRPGPKGPSLLPVFVAIAAIVCAALAVAVMQNTQKEATAPEAPESGGSATQENNPFSDVANDPGGRPSTRKTLVDSAPAGLADAPVFMAAKVLATDAKALVKEAKAARDAGDEETFQEKGRIARGKLETAFEKTTDWLMDLQERYPNDRQIARIEAEMLTWDRALKAVRKVR